MKVAHTNIYATLKKTIQNSIKNFHKKKFQHIILSKLVTKSTVWYITNLSSSTKTF